MIKYICLSTALLSTIFTGWYHAGLYDEQLNKCGEAQNIPASEMLATMLIFPSLVITAVSIDEFDPNYDVCEFQND